MKMTDRKWREMPACRLDRRGVALPLALFGLVAISLLVTTALITSSTELALSSAHQEGTRGLYAADAALEQFVAERAAMTTSTESRLTDGEFSVSLGSGNNFSVDVAEMYRSPLATLSDGTIQRRETFSMIADPQNRRGRSVGAMIEATRTVEPISLNVDSGLTLGTNTTISGNATISDGSSDGAACDSAAAPAAIRHSSETSIDFQGNAHDIFGDVVQDSRGSAELMSWVLDDKSVYDLAAMAHIKFGPMYGKDPFSDGSGPSQSASDERYRWGCPTKLVTGCTAAQAAYFPTVAIDANGGTVEITGTHGQGILVIVNGNVHIRGNFYFGGIILVEGTLRVTGTPRLEGGVIAMGDEAIIDAEDDSEFSSGNSLIRFNRCQIVEAQQGLTEQSLNFAPQLFENSTFAWFEVVR